MSLTIDQKYMVLLRDEDQGSRESRRCIFCNTRIPQNKFACLSCWKENSEEIIEITKLDAFTKFIIKIGAKYETYY